MLRSILTAAGAASLVVGIAAYAQAPATPGTPQAAGRTGANAGSLTCNVAGGIGFVFGSSKDLSCLFWRTDGIGERYTGSIKKYGVDLGFTKEAQMVWLVFAPGNIGPGALAGNYVGATASATVGVGAGANVLVGPPAGSTWVGDARCRRYPDRSPAGRVHGRRGRRTCCPRGG